MFRRRLLSTSCSCASFAIQYGAIGTNYASDYCTSLSLQVRALHGRAAAREKASAIAARKAAKAQGGGGGGKRAAAGSVTAEPVDGAEAEVAGAAGDGDGKDAPAAGGACGTTGPAAAAAARGGDLSTLAAITARKHASWVLAG